jgi:protein-S-isoprenylcysteine O-methyltransferase Ste14
MYILFFICVLGVIAVIPFHFLSVEHPKLQKKYGRKKGTRVGEIYSFISGWGFFIFWIGIWMSPQVRFTIPVFQNLSILVPLINFSIPIFHLAIFIPLFTIGAWFGVEGVEEIGLKAAETHKSEKIVTTNVYSVIRHPQYFGGFLAHIGISFLLSAWYSTLSTPLMIVLIYLISRKEEEELIKEFGKEYEDYRKRVPMFIPKFKKSNSDKDYS